VVVGAVKKNTKRLWVKTVFGNGGRCLMPERKGMGWQKLNDGKAVC
jgi:hypothetical protein